MKIENDGLSPARGVINGTILEDFSIADLIKIARRNLKDMQPGFKMEITDRILEIIGERLNEKTDLGSHVNDGHADKP